MPTVTGVVGVLITIRAAVSAFHVADLTGSWCMSPTVHATAGVRKLSTSQRALGRSQQPEEQLNAELLQASDNSRSMLLTLRVAPCHPVEGEAKDLHDFSNKMMRAVEGQQPSTPWLNAFSKNKADSPARKETHHTPWGARGEYLPDLSKMQL